MRSHWVHWRGCFLRRCIFLMRVLADLAGRMSTRSNRRRNFALRLHRLADLITSHACDLRGWRNRICMAVILMIRFPLNRLMQKFDSRQKSIDRSGLIMMNALRDCTTLSCVPQSCRDEDARPSQRVDRASEDWSRRKFRARRKSGGAKTEN